MPTPPLSEELCREAVQVFEKARGNYDAAAQIAGVKVNTLRSRLHIAAGRGFVPDLTREPDQFTQYEAIHGKPRIRVKAWTGATPPEGPVQTIVAIGDHHDKPGRDKTHARWLGRFCADKAPDYIVSIGDWASLDSLSAHEVPGSANDADRPAFHEDLDSLDESISTFHRDLPPGSIPVYQTHGNHEERAWRAANRQPKLNGDMPARLDTVFARYQWQTLPFGEYLNLAGVDFVHCPMSIMSKPMGGEHVERTVGNKTLNSTVFGHSHRRNVVHMPKINHRQVTVINLGTSMPHGVVEKYSKIAMTGWSWGVYLLRVQGGVILSEKFFDMLELRETYGD